MTFDRWSHNQTCVLNGLLHVYEKDGRATFREVSAAAGLSLRCTYDHLLTLRKAGLVDWDDGRMGTLRPLVEVVR